MEETLIVSTGTGRTPGLWGIVFGALLLSACASAPPGEEQQVEPKASPVATSAAQPSQGLSRATAVTSTPGGNAAAEVSPGDVTVGSVTLSFSLQPARHMFDMASAADLPSPEQQQQDRSRVQTKGSAVFAGGMLKVANNIDPSQNPPADSPQAIVRHVVLQVKDRSSGQVIPYLAVTMDVLLDGRPAIFDQALAPMVAVDSDSPQLYYGNNVKFPGRGTYQVFIRMQRHPLLGPDQPQAAQFNLTIR